MKGYETVKYLVDSPFVALLSPPLTLCHSACPISARSYSLAHPSRPWAGPVFSGQHLVGSTKPSTTPARNSHNEWDDLLGILTSRD